MIRGPATWASVAMDDVASVYDGKYPKKPQPFRQSMGCAVPLWFDMPPCRDIAEGAGRLVRYAALDAWRLL